MQKRENGIDILKTLAIISVVIIHVASSGCFLPIGSADWVISLFFGSAARFAVPVFFMCSGALLLNPEKEISVKKLWRKNMLKIVGALFLWAAFYKLFALGVANNLSGAGILNAIKELFLFDHEFHLYYLHMMILVYAFLPVTRLLTCKADKRELEYFLLFWVVTGIVFPTVIVWKPFSLVKGFPLEWKMNMTYSAVGYTVLGYYLKKYPLTKKKSLFLFVSGFLLTFVPVVLLSVKFNYLYEHLWMGMTVNICLMATGLYGLFINSTRGGKAVSYISRASFTVYLSHVFFLKIFEAKGLIPGNLGYTPLTVPVVSALIFVLSLAVYEVFRRIKVMKSFI